jgi:hypothetical protein
MRDTLLGPRDTEDAEAGVSGTAVVETLAAATAGGSGAAAVSLRGVLAGRLLGGRALSMGSYVHVASWVLQLAHVGRSALHLIWTASVLPGHLHSCIRPMLTDLPPAAEGARLGRPFARPARRVCAAVSTAVAHGMRDG